MKHSNPSKGPLYLLVNKHISEDCSDVLGQLVGYKSLPAKHRVLYKPARVGSDPVTGSVWPRGWVDV